VKDFLKETSQTKHEIQEILKFRREDILEKEKKRTAMLDQADASNIHVKSMIDDVDDEIEMRTRKLKQFEGMEERLAGVSG